MRLVDERAVLVDSNILIDISSGDPIWYDWSRENLSKLAGGRLILNPIVLSEFSVRFETMEAVDDVLEALEMSRENLPWEAGFIAGRAFHVYRRAGGARERTLPDLLIGAHAYVMGHRLLTRDGMRYRTYFPDLDLIAPAEQQSS
ncbi:type II toxin-antitoxin system VapC family toxin [Notoacmeibacter sp. MSK16QG-6]|uniref:type II toxin-antitoxin system VapC family toxin n=1 Tax=Notoacmeibacter sp. MSK16QG-6 TaxID=2957982 RepID=UPI0020A096E7|nr:type II toxin-antitoxin system VapC family toxin [Notoacmeibacter sp. MSK16QG-6]MCP1200125.1 type II toxin-antitoxin system VapC family toxin [Notoacmeibacter sp. MSK16QG-6]